MEVCMGKIKMSVNSAYIECATGNWYHRIELTDSFLLKYRYWTFTKITVALPDRSFERLTSLLLAIVQKINARLTTPN